ncbi:MAG: hypothetical protein H6606_05360 [Flavobacteriales bacterium]|nr:hypothetical protein [Flavobacteriales bacterium]
MRIVFLFISLLLGSTFCPAQNAYYFGFDIGPKMDFFRLEAATNPYSPNIELNNDLAAAAGFTGGVLIEDRFLLETGIYRSNFKTRFRLLDEEGMVHFDKEPVSTLNAYLVPVIFALKAQTSIPRWQFFYGFGFNSMVSSTSAIDGTVVSVQSPKNPDDPSAGYLQYTLSGNALAGRLLSVLATYKALYAINDQLQFSLALEGRYGASGDNFLNINHVSPLGARVENVISTSGNALQLNVGFRYFLDPIPVENRRDRPHMNF